MNQILVFVDGGCVEVKGVPPDTVVTVVDLDTDGADPDDLVFYKEDDGSDPTMTPAFVEEYRHEPGEIVTPWEIVPYVEEPA